MKKIIFILVVITLTVGAFDLRPANTTTTTFVVWDPNILAQYGIFPQITAGELVQMEGLPILSASEAAAIGANPSILKSPSAADILAGLSITPIGTRPIPPAGAALVGGQTPREPTSTRKLPKTRITD